MEVTTPVLVIWLGICAFFRDGPRHGYDNDNDDDVNAN
jgi:hypothetical protein